MTRTVTTSAVLFVLWGTTFSLAQSVAAPKRHSKPETAAEQQERQLIEQLDERIKRLESDNAKYQLLEQQVESLKKELDEANRAAANAQQAAADARAGLNSLTSQNEETVSKLQSDVRDVRNNSVSLADTLQTEQTEVKSLESPDALRFKGVRITPGGFIAGETVWRQRGIGGDVNTSFASIPFSGQTAGRLSEFNASGRQSRVAMLVEGKLPQTAVRGYYESDFLSAGTTSNDNQSNSYTLRVRQAWGGMQLARGWDITAGQMWSLATEDTSGIANLKEAIPLTIDAQYTVGFTWERQYAFRATKKIGNFWAAGSIEEPQTLNIGGHNLPTIAYQQAGNAGGLYNPTANYSFNLAPDVLAKIAYDSHFGHFEVFGVGRFFRDRVFPNGPPPPGAPQPPTTSALGAFTDKAVGGGVGADARISLLAKSLTIGAHILAGDGIGRYSSAALPDATAHPDGSLELLTGGSALGSLEWHAAPRLDLYAYYGGEYAKRAFYNTGYFVVTPGPTQGQPILGGYGAPTNPVYGCNIEVLPVTSPNGNGNAPGSATNCQADNRNIQEGTAGYWYRLYQGNRGVFQQGLQYSYLARHTWQGIGDPLTGLGGSPKAIDNMIFTSFRYYLPK